MRSRRLVSGAASHLEGMAELTPFLSDLGYYRGGPKTREPIILAYTPVARTNPLQSLLYSESLRYGVAALPVKHWSQLPEIPWDGHMVCHLHWVADVLRGAESEAEAEARVGSFADVLQVLRQQGRRLIWTAHNVLPHDSPMEHQEVAVRRVLLDKCDAIHIMSSATPQLFEQYVDFPTEKSFFAPHPSYVGAYPDYVTEAEARSEFGIRADDFVILLFGALQRYKGLGDLQVAFETAAPRADGRRFYLLVAGAPPSPEEELSIRLWAAGRDDVHAAPLRVPLEDVQYYYRAADIAVLPYRKGLNSGAALLALSFGVPVLASTSCGLGDLLQEFNCFSYDADDPSALANSLEKLSAADLTEVRSIISERIPRLAPNLASEHFCTSLLKALGWSRKRSPR